MRTMVEEASASTGRTLYCNCTSTPWLYGLPSTLRPGEHTAHVRTAERTAPAKLVILQAPMHTATISTARLVLLAVGMFLFGPAAEAMQEASGTLARLDLSASRAVHHPLPRELAEVSGLATTADGRLFAHGDERAVVFQLDPRSGAVLKRFRLGPRGVQGDFEGIAIAGDRFFLVDSRATLYEFREGEDGTSVPYRSAATGLADRCEVEGLAYDASTDALLLACKTTRGASLRNHIVVFALPLSRGRREATPRLRIPLAALTPFGLRESFHISGLEVHPSGTLVLIAARDEAVLEVSREGRLLHARRLDRRRHPQVEGVAFLRDGTLLLADEAHGRAAATLTVYPPRTERAARPGS